MRIAIIKSWQSGREGRQWPARPPAEFAGIEFDFDSTDGADFVVALNGVAEDRLVECPPDQIWAMIQEPPNPYYVKWHDGQPAFSRIYTTDSHYRDAQHIPFFGALVWHVEKSYDELVAAPYPAKPKTLSWITSTASDSDGHRLRMKFLRRLQASGLPFDLYGRGFRDLGDKWDGIAPYRYSIAFENYADDLYWSEKITDCFLGFATPFYFGTSTIGRYFPKDSYIRLDPYDRHVFRRMQDRIEEGFHEQHLEALREARELCLNRYNTLFYIAREAMAYRPDPPLPPAKVLIHRIAPQGSSASRWLPHVGQRLRRLGRRLGIAVR